ncbi:hypothetical protein Drorol1_Dr00010667 [Drosera rotundifolia]
MATNTFKLCSLLMASLFAACASVQLDDPDWYFWLPLYSFASYVNLMSCWLLSSRRLTAKISVIAFLLGFFLFVKVVVEDHVNGIAGFCSVDTRERVVREKIGSGLVLVSMGLHLVESSIGKDNERQNTERSNASLHVQAGMVSLVCISYGLSLFFLLYHEEEMKF